MISGIGILWAKKSTVKITISAFILGKKHLKSDDDEEEEEEEEQDKCTMSFCYGDPENAFVW